MSWKEEGLTLDVDTKLPEPKKIGKRNVGYEKTINSFLESKKGTVHIPIPEDIKLSSLRLGLKSTITRLDKENERRLLEVVSYS